MNISSIIFKYSKECANYTLKRIHGYSKNTRAVNKDTLMPISQTYINEIYTFQLADFFHLFIS